MGRCVKKGLAVWILAVAIGVPPAVADEGVPSATWRGPEVHTLIGIVVGEPDHAQAVFEDLSTGRQRLYRVGDRMEGASVSRIERRQVWLRKGDQTVVMTVGRGRSEDRPVSAPIPSSGALSDAGKRLQKVLQSEKPPYDPSVEKRRVLQKDLDRFILGLQERRDQGGAMEPTAYGPSLSLAGLDPGLLSGLNLDPADRIVGISGMGLDSEARFNDILNVLKRARVFNLSVLRRDAVLSLYYSTP